MPPSFFIYLFKYLLWVVVKSAHLGINFSVIEVRPFLRGLLNHKESRSSQSITTLFLRSLAITRHGRVRGHAFCKNTRSKSSLRQKRDLLIEAMIKPESEPVWGIDITLLPFFISDGKTPFLSLQLDSR